MELSSPVTSVPGIGASLSGRLQKLDIATVFDLLYHLPFRFEDRRHISRINQVQPGEVVTVKGTITAIKNEFTRSGRFIQKAVISDDSGSLDVSWFNQSFLVRSLKNRTVSLSGKVDFFGPKKTLISPEYEFITSSQPVLLHTGRLVPIYPETAGISSKLLRTKLFNLVHNLTIDDFLPRSYGLMSWKQALTNSHFPADPKVLTAARNRLAFDELLLLQLSALIHRHNWNETELSHSFHVDQKQIDTFISSLPFSLTLSQKTAISEILIDVSKDHPMNRLLGGDVGSGKTVVAAVAAFISHYNKLQTIIMAPTQILAHQHFQTLSALFHPFNIPVTLVTSTVKPKSVSASEIIVGTHALISAKNISLFQNAGLVVIDEQHRFGVAQRQLAGKLGKVPHILTMTATPIPRTVALTMFGDLDLSYLTDKPVGRQPVKTWIVPESKRTASYSWIENEIATTGRQVIWVCPFINESDTAVSVKAAVTEYDRLKKMFPRHKVGLLHGKLKAAEKDRVINDFRSGQIHILIATPVVEVGLDIPNAGIMVIEGAERFGLAQLHQLRGRVGRSTFQSYCLLYTSDRAVSERLKAMETFHTGRELSEIDLRLRGPGDVYGLSQHGFPQFKVATFENLGLIELAKKAATEILPSLPDLHVLRDLLKEDKIALTRPN